MRKYIFAFLVLTGCQSKITGSIQIDGNPFSITSCRAGQATGFSGVDLLSKDGRKLRLVYDPSARAQAYLFLPDQHDGIELGMCGPFSIERQSSRINSIYNHRGNATLNCNNNGHSVRGNVTFENCH